MKVKVFQTNPKGKIEFTHAELEKLLNEVYSDGYREGESDARSHTWTWTSPYLTNTPYYGTITACNTDADKSIDSLTCKSVITNNTIKPTADNSVSTRASGPFTYTIDLGKCDSEAISKVANEIVSKAHESIRNQATRKDNDPIANLAKELGL